MCNHPLPIRWEKPTFAKFRLTTIIYQINTYSSIECVHITDRYMCSLVQLQHFIIWQFSCSPVTKNTLQHATHFFPLTNLVFMWYIIQYIMEFSLPNWVCYDILNGIYHKTLKKTVNKACAVIFYSNDVLLLISI